MCVEKELWKIEYTTVVDTFTNYLSLFVKAFVVYVGMLGVALKFALEEGASSQQKLGMSVFSFCASAAFVGLIIATIQLTKLLGRRRQVAQEQLGMDTMSEFIAGYWAAGLSAAFVLVAASGWILIAFQGV